MISIKRSIAMVAIVGMVFGVAVSDSVAADAPEISVKADLELFYELSHDVNGSGDNDKFESNQLYVDFGAKFENNLAAKLKLDDMKDAKDLDVADGSIEDSVLFGVRAKF